MDDPAETPQPRWRWLDWWFAPPWRALLTWMLLASAMGAVLHSGQHRFLRHTYDFIGNKVWQVAPSLIPSYLIIDAASITPLLVWYQPVVLRVGLIRWLLWMVAVVLTYAALDYFELLYSIDWFNPNDWAWKPLAGLLLIGRRTRPWLALPASVLCLPMEYWLYQRIQQSWVSWLWFPLEEFPYAALLLYGTRLLTPEERQQRQGVSHAA